VEQQRGPQRHRDGGQQPRAAVEDLAPEAKDQNDAGEIEQQVERLSANDAVA
jgi:hypothetical protein